MDMLAYNPVEFNFLETLAGIFIVPAKQSQSVQANFFNNCSVRRIAIAMSTNSAFTGFYSENPFWYQQFDLRQTRILKRGQPNVEFDAADYCRFYVRTMKAKNFQLDIPLIPNDNFKDHFVLVFDLISMHDFSEDCHYREHGKPLKMELQFTFLLEQVTELIVLGDECVWLQLTSLVLLEQISKMDNVSLEQKKSTVSHYSSTGTVVFSPLFMVQLLTMTLLPL